MVSAATLKDGTILFSTRGSGPLPRLPPDETVEQSAGAPLTHLKHNGLFFLVKIMYDMEYKASDRIRPCAGDCPAEKTGTPGTFRSDAAEHRLRIPPLSIITDADVVRLLHY